MLHALLLSCTLIATEHRNLLSIVYGTSRSAQLLTLGVCFSWWTSRQRQTWRASQH